MTSSAPRERTRPAFGKLHTPVTLAPDALAICTANDPTPPAAPITITCCPGCTRPLSRTACSAVTPEIGTTAACSKNRPAGLAASRCSCAAAYSANEPLSPVPYTWSPAPKRVTRAPTAATTPATSRPRTLTVGAKRQPQDADKAGLAGHQVP